MPEQNLRQTMRYGLAAQERQLDHAEPELAAAESGLGEWEQLKRQLKKESIPRLRGLSKRIRGTLVKDFGGRLRGAIRKVARFDGITWRTLAGWWLRFRIFLLALVILLIYGLIIGLIGGLVYLGIQLASGVSS